MAKHTVTVPLTGTLAGTVIGTWSGPGPGLPVAPPGADINIYEVSDAEMRLLNESGIHYPGGKPRWRRPDPGQLEEIVDDRQWIEFVPDNLEADVGDAPFPLLTIRILTGASTPLNRVVDTSYNSPPKGDRIELSTGRTVRIVFSSGVATRTIKTVRPLDMQIEPNDRFRVMGTGHVRVYGTSFEEF